MDKFEALYDVAKTLYNCTTYIVYAVYKMCCFLARLECLGEIIVHHKL